MKKAIKSDPVDEQPDGHIYDENLDEPNSIRTVSGHYLNVLNPDPDAIVIEDIAHALSMLPRFGGHLPVFYSVAQHCVSCSRFIGPKNRLMRLSALLHDAAEAYVVDLPRPIKKLLPDYKEIENRILEVIAQKFGAPYVNSEEIKKLDRTMLKIEWNSVMLDGDKAFRDGIGWPQHQAKRLFLETFYNLYE